MKCRAAEHEVTQTVLVAEDKIMVRMPIAEYLRYCGHHGVEASDAIAAMASEEPVGVVFSDIRMPGATAGFALADWFQSHHPGVPVLLTSGYNAGVRRQSLAGGSSKSCTRKIRLPGG